MRSAGPAVHNAVGKFRFLNELIKLVSPKVCEHRKSLMWTSRWLPRNIYSTLLFQYTPNTPKELVDRILFDMNYWSYNLPDLVKIHEACHMMKEQGERIYSSEKTGIKK